MTEEQIIRLYGRRCAEHCDDCCVCEVWAMHDLIETQAREIERLRKKLRSIEKGAENGQALFTERQGNRAKPIWYAVNVLQDHLAACKGTARAALAGDSHDQ